MDVTQSHAKLLDPHLPQTANGHGGSRDQS